MLHRRCTRLVIPLVLVALPIHLAGFAAHSLDGLLGDAPSRTACGCGDDCTCGCLCCDAEATEPPSCCRGATAALDGDGPAWNAACGCGGHGAGAHAVVACFRPALPAAAASPVLDDGDATCPSPATSGLLTRPRIPDDPVPRVRS